MVVTGSGGDFPGNLFLFNKKTGKFVRDFPGIFFKGDRKPENLFVICFSYSCNTMLTV